MKSKGLGCLIFFLVFLLLASVAVNFLQFAAHFGMGEGLAGDIDQPPKFHEMLEQKGAAESKDKIVRLDLEGIISNGPAEGLFGAGGFDLESLKRALQQATEDKSVKAIVLRIDSPGGEVTASDTLYHAVKEAAKKVPVVVYMDSLAASGGYYISCGATKIVANETTLTGSIGVIIQSLNYSGAFGKVGMETMTFVSGTFKDTLGGSRPMRDDEKAYVQGLVTNMYDRFLGIVSEARNIDKETLKYGIADGRVFTGGEALQKKLVDQIGYIEDAYTTARNLGRAPNASVVRYQNRGSLRDLLGAFSSAQDAKGHVKIDLSDRLIPRLQPGKMYLLPAHMAP
ncbi:MAG: signal peptide peptidase SppA [Verrucomicrobia bacterium]|nr:signal peptide peptidase SppA [Verrucomicrobiota bacterium]